MSTSCRFQETPEVETPNPQQRLRLFAGQLASGIKSVPEVAQSGSLTIGLLMTPRNSKASRIYCGTESSVSSSPSVFEKTQLNAPIASRCVSIESSRSPASSCANSPLEVPLRRNSARKASAFSSDESRPARAVCSALPRVGRNRRKDSTINGSNTAERANSCSKVTSPNSTRRFGISASFAFRPVALAEGVRQSVSRPVGRDGCFQREE